MAGLRESKSNAASAVAGEAVSELMDDFEDLDATSDTDDGEDQPKSRFLKSTDVRRRIEEQLEVRLLRDELGMDDIDID